MTNKITDLENQPQQRRNIIKDLDQLRTLTMEELNQKVIFLRRKSYKDETKIIFLYSKDAGP